LAYIDIAFFKIKAKRCKTVKNGAVVGENDMYMSVSENERNILLRNSWL